MKESKKDWEEYYKITKDLPPSKLLLKALPYISHRNRAIDIGAGALKDTRYLLSQGFDVIAIDNSQLMAKTAEGIKSEKFHYYVTLFHEFIFPENTFDLANASYALPFNSPVTFGKFIGDIKKSLVSGGIFCGQLFGVRDEWKNRYGMTFHTKQQAEKLFSDTEILYFEEEEKDGTIANGTPKHWHIFHFIVKKK